MSEAKVERKKPESSSLARKIADFQGERPSHPNGEAPNGFAAMHAHKQKYMEGVEYRAKASTALRRWRRSLPSVARRFGRMRSASRPRA